MKTRNRWILSAVAIAAVLVLHEVLLRWMDEGNVVASLFAADGHVPMMTLALACLFLAVRLVAVLFLPGLILSAIVGWLLSRRDVPGKPAGAGHPTSATRN